MSKKLKLTPLASRAKLVLANCALALALVGGYAFADKPNVALSADQHEPARLIASIKPLHALVQGVAEGVNPVDLLISTNVSPHSFHLKPSNIRQLQRAQVIFYISPHFETFLPRALASFPQNNAMAVATLPSLELLKIRSGAAWVPHDHGHGGHDDHDDHAKHDDHGHNGHDDHAKHDDHGKHTDHDNHGHGGHDDHDDHAHEALSETDLHLWLDPRNAIHIVRGIAQRLSEINPHHRETYNKNAQSMIARLNALDVKLARELTAVQNRPFIVLHDAYQYFERRYGLTAVGSILIEPNRPLSPRRLLSILDQAKQTKALCVFREPQFPAKLVRTAFVRMDIRIGTLDPIGAQLEPGTNAYFQLIEQLATTLKACLA